MSSSTEIGVKEAEQCVALCSYDRAAADEISFKKGDRIHVTSKTVCHAGYWRGYVDSSNNENSTEGLFPNCFVTSHPNAVSSLFSSLPLYPEHVENKALCLKDIALMGTSKGLNRGQVINIVRFDASHKSFIISVHPSQDALLEASTPSPQYMCPEGSPLTFNIVVAVIDFVSANPGELSFRVGETVVVHRRWNDGWWEGSILSSAEESRDRRGLFPSNFTIPNVCTTPEPAVFCSVCKLVFQDLSHNRVPECTKCSLEKDALDEMLHALHKHHLSKSTKPVDLFEFLSVVSRTATKSSHESSARIVS